MVQKKNTPLITNSQGKKMGKETSCDFLNILEYQIQKVIFVKEAELVLSASVYV